MKTYHYISIDRESHEKQNKPEEEQMGFAHEEDNRPVDVFEMDTQAAKAARSW